MQEIHLQVPDSPLPKLDSKELIDQNRENALVIDSNRKQQCIICKKGEEDHAETFLCMICYNDQLVINKVDINCAQNCTSCSSCLTSSIVAQFDQARIKDFKCLCGGDEINESLLERYLGEDQFKKLKRLRLSRKIDTNPNMIWCPNIDCEKEIEKKGRQRKV